MNHEKTNHYANVLLNAYQNGFLKIVWNTSGFSLGVPPQKEHNIPELKEKEFIDYAFSIIKIVMDLAENRENEHISESDLKIAQTIFKQEKDLIHHLYVKHNSKIHCYKLLESQIISYRNGENPQKVETNSAILKLILDKDDNDTSFTFEISRRDIEDLIDQLTELKEKIDSIPE